MQAKLMDETAQVVTLDGDEPVLICELRKGDVFDLGKVVKKRRVKWTEATLDDGTAGFVHGNVKVFIMLRAKSAKRKLKVYLQPSRSSEVIAMFNKRNEFQLLDTFKEGRIAWVQIKDTTGLEGFIDGNAKINVIDAPETRADKRKAAIKDIKVGAIWFFAGLAITLGTYNAAQGNGGTYLITWGAILFGGLQCLKGIINSVIYAGDE